MGLILIRQFHPQVQFFKLYPRRRKLAASAQFKIHNSLPVPILSAFSTLSPVPPVPLVPQFKIPFALFRAHYRLKKLFSLWCIKENRTLIILYFTDRKGIEILTTHLIHYLHLEHYSSMTSPISKNTTLLNPLFSIYSFTFSVHSRG